MHHHLIHADGLVVDTTTGEIIGHDDKPSAYADPYDYKPCLTNFRSVDDLNAYLGHVDLRKLPPRTRSNLTAAQDAALGEWFRSRKKVDCRISEPMMNLLCQMHGLVKYRNIIIMTQAGLAKELDTLESNLMKKLNILIKANMMRVSTSRHGNIRKGEIKITLHPRLIFRGDDAKRGNCIDAWYRDWMTLHPHSAFSMNKRGWDDSTITTAAIAA